MGITKDLQVGVPGGLFSGEEWKNSTYMNTHHALLQGIFLTQGSNLRLLWLLHCRQILYH